MVVVFWLAFAFLAVQLLTLVSNLIFFPSLSSAEFKKTKDERVSLLIPARNEAVNLPETLPKVLMQPEADEVIVLNDNSTDATAKILSEFEQTYPHLKVIQGKTLAEGWTGKNWACQQLSEAATGQTLIFTDADVHWQKGTLAALLNFQSKQKADFVSVWPRQVTVSALETITIPVIDQILLGSLPYLGVKYSKLKVFSAGNGQLMMWCKQAYDTVGGHAAFKQEVLEDVRMGQAAKGAGLRGALAVGATMISTRMYHTDKAMLEGFSKNILAASSNKLNLVALMVLNTLVHTLSWLFILIKPYWLVIALMSLSLRLLTSLKTKQNLSDSFWQPLTPLPIWLIVGRALSQKRLSWKGRHYP